MGPFQQDDAPYVSTGQLPSPEQVRRAVDEAYQRYRAAAGGQRSQIYPALARVPAGLFSICAVGTSGGVHAIGDADHGFAVMSVAKPFVFALVCQALGPEEARDRLGANATGLPFNSLTAVERGPDGRTNPMVNAGAIATTSLAPGGSQDERWEFLRDGCRGSRASRCRSTRRSTPRPRPPTIATAPWPTCWRATAVSAAARPRPPSATPARAACR
jgi:glutaminase